MWCIGFLYLCYSFGVTICYCLSYHGYPHHWYVILYIFDHYGYILSCWYRRGCIPFHPWRWCRIFGGIFYFCSFCPNILSSFLMTSIWFSPIQENSADVYLCLNASISPSVACISFLIITWMIFFSGKYILCPWSVHTGLQWCMSCSTGSVTVLLPGTSHPHHLVSMFYYCMNSHVWELLFMVGSRACSWS